MFIYLFFKCAMLISISSFYHPGHPSFNELVEGYFKSDWMGSRTPWNQLDSQACVPEGGGRDQSEGGGGESTQAGHATGIRES